MKFVLSIDQGTTGTRAMIFNHRGEEVSKSYVQHKQIFPQPGWVEHDPEEIWENTLNVIKDAISLANLDAKQICSIGVTNQRETVVAWNKETNKPLNNAIVWQCRRTADICETLKKDGFFKIFNSKTGLVLDPYFSGTKIKWLLANSSKVQDQLKIDNLAVGTIDSWLIWNLTGEHVTDFSNASRTLLFNIHTGEWDNELLEIMKIPESILPEVRPSSDKDFYGFTKKQIQGSEVPVAGCAGDQQAALFGQTCFEEGDVKNTYGTGNFMLMNSGNRAIQSKNGLLTTIAWKIDNTLTYALEGSVFITGAAIQWLEKGIKILESKEELTRVMNETPDTQGVFFVPAFVGLGAPYWDSYARGTMVGLTRGTTRDHIIRATLESICFQSEDVFEAMSKDSGNPITVLRVDGGVTNCLPLLQFQADISNIIVQKPKVNETTALGAAYLAGLAINYWENLEDIRQNFLIEHTFESTMTLEKREALKDQWTKAIRQTRS
ncbi:MAG: glycerol kinase GlpK [Candidatus Heimdallarchaeota archaeon]|nr:glycerol kinase GlpK [Candidatus Heimdallarchaeota archaeon]MCK4877714.1 glycerol kinase GlpK [Candidatus Heimdallarchaeota archaeon]